MSPPTIFVLPGAIDTPTGGYRYDRAIIDGLRGSGREVSVIELGGAFPQPNDADRAAARARFAGLPAGAVVIVDGLALGCLAEEIGALPRPCRLVGLVHHPLADEQPGATAHRAALEDQERLALSGAVRIAVTSPYTKDRLGQMGLAASRIDIIQPGIAPRPPAEGTPPGLPKRLICAASFTRRKGHDILLDALAACRDLPWHLTAAGPADLDPGWAERVKSRARALGLAERIDFAGNLDERRLAELHLGADIAISASHYEGYGMALAEAMAYGLPIVATRGGAIPSVVPAEAGLLVPPGDAAALAAALRRILQDSALRGALAAGARRAAAALWDWPRAVRAFAELIDRVAATSAGHE